MPTRTELIEAYKFTNYTVDSDSGPLAIRIGHPSPDTDRLLQKFDATSLSIITAWNPRSRLLTKNENYALQEKLVADLKIGGFTILAARGEGTDGWVENSVAVLDLPRADLEQLAQAYSQNAVVRIEQSREAELICMFKAGT